MLFKGQALSKGINNKEWEKHQKERDFLRRKRAFLQGGCSEYQTEEASLSLARTAHGAADLQSRQNSAPCWGQKFYLLFEKCLSPAASFIQKQPPAFIGEEERRAEGCRLKLVWKSHLNTAPPTHGDLLIPAGWSRAAKTCCRRAVVLLSNVFMPTDNKSQKISYFWH